MYHLNSKSSSRDPAVLHIKSFDYTVGTLWNIIIRYSGYNFGFLGLAAANAETVRKVNVKLLLSAPHEGLHVGSRDMAPLIPKLLTSGLNRGESGLAEILVAIVRVNSEDGECNVCQNVGTASK